MTTHTGTDAIVTIATNTVAEAVDYSIDEAVNTLDDTALGDAADTHLAGTTNWNASITCHWDEEDSTGQEAMLIGASLAVVFLPEGNTSGDVSLTGTATITGRSLSVTVNGVISQSFTLQGNGALVRGTVT